jgi:hypothetical protein
VSATASGFAIFSLFVIVFFLSRLWDKLNDIERSLKVMKEHLAEANSSLRSIAHDSEVIRERTPL